MSECQKCKSNRLASIMAKSSDCNFVRVADHGEHDGYVPHDMGIGGGDYVEFSYCLECGTIEGTFPLPKCALEKKDEVE